jgi:hypothetical protein
MKAKNISYERLSNGLDFLFSKAEALLLEFRHQQHYSLEQSGYCRAICDVKELVESLINEKDKKTK